MPGTLTLSILALAPTFLDLAHGSAINLSVSLIIRFGNAIMVGEQAQGRGVCAIDLKSVGCVMNRGRTVRLRRSMAVAVGVKDARSRRAPVVCE